MAAHPFQRLTRFARTVAVGLLLPAAALALTSCYLPARFQTDVVVSQAGYYEIAFTGQVVWAPLYKAVRDGDLTRAEEKEKVAQIERDLARDPAAKSVSYAGRGAFNLRWLRAGDLIASGMAAFIRRGERLLTLQYDRGKRLMVLRGRTVPEDTARRLGAAAGAVDGTVSVFTDARVLEHNADEVDETAGGERLYRWRIEHATDPAPFMVMAALR